MADVEEDRQMHISSIPVAVHPLFSPFSTFCVPHLFLDIYSASPS